MVAERGRGEGGRGDGGSNGRKTRRRRVAALVAPEEGGGHRGAGTVADGDSPKEDESSLRPGDPGTSSEATTGASGSTATLNFLFYFFPIITIIRTEVGEHELHR